LSEVDIQVILNELKHIREDLAEVKLDAKNKCKDCIEIELVNNKIETLKEKIDEFEDLPIRVTRIESSNSTLIKMLPYGTTFLGWLLGGGWKYFAG
jgi:DNA repair exonuclease SbcCD ATPase subunit